MEAQRQETRLLFECFTLFCNQISCRLFLFLVSLFFVKEQQDRDVLMEEFEQQGVFEQQKVYMFRMASAFYIRVTCVYLCSVSVATGDL